MSVRAERGKVTLVDQRSSAQGSPGGSGGFIGAMREFMYGMAGYEFARHAIETRAALQTIFMATTVGDMVGLPIIPPYYSMRLLPYVVPEVETWKRRVLREKEFTEEHEFDLHGV
jgi:hypothetical protein